MKLCQENTELAEKLKSIIDQYELREEVRAAPWLPVGMGSKSSFPRGQHEASPACSPWQLSLGCLVEVTRAASITLCCPSMTRHTASLPDPVWPALQPRNCWGRHPACSTRGSLAMVGREAGLSQCWGVPATCWAAPHSLAAPPNPQGAPQHLFLLPSPRPHWALPTSHLFGQACSAGDAKYTFIPSRHR